MLLLLTVYRPVVLGGPAPGVASGSVRERQGRSRNWQGAREAQVRADRSGQQSVVVKNRCSSGQYLITNHSRDSGKTREKIATVQRRGTGRAEI